MIILIGFTPILNCFTLGQVNNWSAVSVLSANATLSGTLTAASSTGTSGQYLKSTGSGVEWGTVDALPSQTGQSGNYLTTNGTTASWAAITTDPTPTVFLLMGA